MSFERTFRFKTRHLSSQNHAFVTFTERLHRNKSILGKTGIEYIIKKEEFRFFSFLKINSTIYSVENNLLRLSD